MSVLEEPSTPGEATVEELSPAAFEDFFRREYPAMVALAAAVRGPPTGRGSRPGSDAPGKALEPTGRLRQAWDLGADLRHHRTPLDTRQRRGSGGQDTACVVGGAAKLAEQPQAMDPDLLDALQTLSPHQRAAVSLHYLEDRSTPEIADFLGCSESTARVHLHRGRHALAEHLGATR